MILLTSLAEIENSSVAITTGGESGSAVESKPGVRVGARVRSRARVRLRG